MDFPVPTEAPPLVDVQSLRVHFDTFHAVKLVNDAVDKVRREESKGRPANRMNPTTSAPSRLSFPHSVQILHPNCVRIIKEFS